MTHGAFANELAITFSGEPLDGAKRRMTTSLAIGVRAAGPIPGGCTREIVCAEAPDRDASATLERYLKLSETGLASTVIGTGTSSIV